MRLRSHYVMFLHTVHATKNYLCIYHHLYSRDYVLKLGHTAFTAKHLLGQEITHINMSCIY